MTRKTWAVKLSLVAMVTLLSSDVAEAAWAAPCVQCPGEGQVCIPNASQYGHFQKVWRAWPGTPPLDRTFPDAIGREAVPTPGGHKQEPLPRITVPKTGPGEYPGGGILPPEPNFGTGVVPEMIPELPAEQDDSGILGIPPGIPPLLPPEKGVIEEPSGNEPPLDLPPAKKDTTDEPSFESTSGVELLPPANLRGEDASEPAMEKPTVMGADLRIHEAVAEDATEDVPSRDTSSEDTIGTGTEVFSRRAAADVKSGDVESGVIKANWDSALEPASPARRARPALLSQAANSISGPINHPAEPMQNAAGVEELVEADIEQGSGETEGVDRLAGRLERIAKAAPVQLDGYCPVTLIENESWALGKKNFRVVHEGQVYLLSGEKQKDNFLADPSRYAPAFSGKDAVLAKEQGKRVTGKIDYCVTYAGRLYMFSNGDTLSKFQHDPKRYAAASHD